MHPHTCERAGGDNSSRRTHPPLSAQRLCLGGVIQQLQHVLCHRGGQPGGRPCWRWWEGGWFVRTEQVGRAVAERKHQQTILHQACKHVSRRPPVSQYLSQYLTSGAFIHHSHGNE